ncbi:endolytic transglycosylase MltG [Nonomuraea lactucae]|uniref:endolytic transglycosylase MltG n=1 Tax=Nonomuraea lactucae TaxID=2249762 RepID=UPI0023DD0FB3|nr:endolytic transglycosylase MltG [Nonomuraea lactucae]
MEGPYVEGPHGGGAPLQVPFAMAASQEAAASRDASRHGPECDNASHRGPESDNASDGGPEGARSATHEPPGEDTGQGDGALEQAGSGDGPSRSGGRGPARRGRESWRRGAVLAAGLTVSVLALGTGVYSLVKPYLDPDDYEGVGGGAVTVRIRPGATASDIGEALASAGVVASARSFVDAAEARSMAHRLKPGHYRLRTGMAAAAALDLLLAPASRVVRRVTVTEGMRVNEAFRRIADQAGLPLKELRAVEPELVGLPPYARGIEGFLFPATYEVEPDATAVDVLAAMVERFGVVARQLDLESRAARVRLTPLEAVTVASIAQAEGGRDSDYPKIARVIYNRLRRDMPLQMDATVTYALGKRTLKVSLKDTRIRSPYNTYARRGLPPGPISNPGRKALTAALRPARGDWYWFVTTDPARRITKFTDKESEFVRYREELSHNLGTN